MDRQYNSSDSDDRAKVSAANATENKSSGHPNDLNDNEKDNVLDTLQETLHSAIQDHAEACLRATRQYKIVRELQKGSVEDEGDSDNARERRRQLQDALNLYDKLRFECDDLGDTCTTFRNALAIRTPTLAISSKNLAKNRKKRQKAREKLKRLQQQNASAQRPGHISTGEGTIPTMRRESVSSGTGSTDNSDSSYATTREAVLPASPVTIKPDHYLDDEEHSVARRNGRRLPPTYTDGEHPEARRDGRRLPPASACPKFKRDMDTDIVTFVDILEAKLRTYNVNIEEYPRIFGLVTENLDLLWVNKFILQKNLSWPDAKQAFLKHFGPKSRSLHRAERWMELKQLDKSGQEFADEVYSFLADNVTPVDTPVTNLQIAQKLRSEYHRALLSAGCNPSEVTTDDLLRRIMTLDPALHRPPASSSSSTSTSQTVPRDAKTKSKRSSRRVDQDSKPTCNFCRRPGHTEADCYSRRNEERKKDRARDDRDSLTDQDSHRSRQDHRRPGSRNRDSRQHSRDRHDRRRGDHRAAVAAIRRPRRDSPSDHARSPSASDSDSALATYHPDRDIGSRNTN
mmetsp:Transcript_40362/g.79305  ORF Transcript_40362/g.79305 Transcript_40362/m.79305 type:complete len:571 (+) Transcript_40362:121-1833(+)